MPALALDTPPTPARLRCIDFSGLVEIRQKPWPPCGADRLGQAKVPLGMIVALTRDVTPAESDRHCIATRASPSGQRCVAEIRGSEGPHVPEGIHGPPDRERAEPSHALAGSLGAPRLHARKHNGIDDRRKTLQHKPATPTDVIIPCRTAPRVGLIAHFRRAANNPSTRASSPAAHDDQVIAPSDSGVAGGLRPCDRRLAMAHDDHAHISTVLHLLDGPRYHLAGFRDPTCSMAISMPMSLVVKSRNCTTCRPQQHCARRWPAIEYGRRLHPRRPAASSLRRLLRPPAPPRRCAIKALGGKQHKRGCRRRGQRRHQPASPVDSRLAQVSSLVESAARRAYPPAGAFTRSGLISTTTNGRRNVAVPRPLRAPRARSRR